MKRKVIACLLIIIIFILSACSNNGKTKNVNQKCNNTLISQDMAEYDEKTRRNVKDYVLKQSSKIDIFKKNELPEFKLIDSSIGDKEIILSGEIHGISENSTLEVMLLKYLNQKFGVRYYLNELPYSYAQVINEYLKNGNEVLLSKLFEDSYGTFFYTNENLEKWRKIYKLNKSLSDKDKIIVIGIDFEQTSWNAISYLYSLLPNHVPSDKIRPYIEKIKEFYNNRYNLDDDVMNFSMKLEKDMKNNIKEYKYYLGDNYFNFWMTNINITYGFESHNKYSSTRTIFNNFRDEIMYKNFVSIYNHLPRGKYYGQFGFNHVFQGKQLGVGWFASLLNKEKSPLKNKVLSIIYVYKDCQMLNQNGSVSKFSSYDFRNNLFAEIMSNNCVLIRLNGDKSPFNNKQILTYDQCICGSMPYDRVTTDYFQYVVIIQNSKSSSKYIK